MYAAENGGSVSGIVSGSVNGTVKGEPKTGGYWIIDKE